MGGISLDYCHSGRTVMVAEDPSEPPWIQGEVRSRIRLSKVLRVYDRCVVITDLMGVPLVRCTEDE